MAELAEVKEKQTQKITLAYPSLAAELNFIISALDDTIAEDLPYETYLSVTREDFDPF